jgi:D-alanyl-D-alanine carboxypeptidase (penicillin-binding protein 5/6)
VISGSALSSPTRRRLAAALAATALIAPLAPASPAAARARNTNAATVPCPRPTPDVRRPARAPARPAGPADDPVLRAVGGDALATDGLVAPSGSPKPPALTATSWLVADLDTGEVLGGCGPHVYQTPASVQKLLLASVVLPKLDPKKVITITQADVDIVPGSSAVGLVRGGKYPVSTLWLGLMLNSGNDAAQTLARVGGGAGGLAQTVAEMNAKAKELGAYETHAVTPSGLDGPGQFTSAYDLALIARADFALPDFSKYALARTTRIPAQKSPRAGGFEIQNENKLIFDYPGALGGKTGFTELARTTYVGAAKRQGRRLVATVLGAETSPLRGYQQGEALLDWGFSLPRDASVGKLVDATTDAAGTAPEPVASPAPTTKIAAPTAVEAAPTTRLTLAAAAAVAIVLAGTPLLLLLTRRSGKRRRRRRTAYNPR